jgi:predicted RNA-binding protein with TRAM domain
MHVPEQLVSLFSGSIEERDGSYTVEIPERELQLGDLEEGATYRVAILPAPAQSDAATEEPPERERGPPGPPVDEGATRSVEIEDIGEQGDGITRVERGYVVIVPDTEVGERVKVEITDVRQNVAFAEVIERVSYYD